MSVVTFEYDPSQMLKASANLLLVGFLVRPCINIASKIQTSPQSKKLLATTILLIINGLFAFIYGLFKLAPDLTNSSATRGILLFYAVINIIALVMFLQCVSLRMIAFWRFQQVTVYVINFFIYTYAVLKTSRYLCYYPVYYYPNTVDLVAIGKYMDTVD
ncbi:hypothetical protein HK100_010423, partial [Physocladia obscura]